MKFDIVIMAYNCTKTISRALDSLVQQTNQEFDVIIVDDDSIDDVQSIVLSYTNLLNIRYVRNEKNLGVTMARQRGMDEVTAEYFAFLDADDILLPNAIEIWKREIELSKPDVIITPFAYLKNNITIRQVPIAMVACHGKVYSTEFLKRYGIREHEKVKCVEDSYLNWQVFDLAKKVSMLTDIVYLQIHTEGSVTTTTKWRKHQFTDMWSANILAKQHILKFKTNPLQNYVDIQKNLHNMLCNEEENHKKFINNIKL